MILALSRLDSCQKPQRLQSCFLTPCHVIYSFLFLCLFFPLSGMFGAFDKPQFSLRIFQAHALGKPKCILTGYVRSLSLHTTTIIFINREASTTKKSTLFPKPHTFLILQYFLSISYGFTEYQILLLPVTQLSI